MHRGPSPALLFVSSLVLAGCASSLPEDPVERALYRDTEQIVRTEERTGWLIDRAALDAISPAMLSSVCQVAPARRQALIAWFDAEIARMGGPAEAAWERMGRDPDAVGELDDLISIERMRTALVDADTRAAADCPFWLMPDPEFEGVQSSAGRFVVLAESVGSLVLSVEDQTVSVGGGGGGRLMPGWGVDEHFTIALGLEVGGNGSFTNDDDREEQGISAAITGAVPLVMRFYGGTWIYDVEIAAVSRWREGNLGLPGVRAAFGFGLSTVRIAGIMPYGLGWVGYEFYPEDNVLPETHMIRAGTRVGGDWDP